MSLIVTTLAGITRKTATGPLRSRAALTRKRATPAISYAKSQSPVSFHSPRLRSGMIDSTSISRSFTLSAGPACRLISPWVRNSGGSPTRRCKSELAELTSARSSLPSFCSAASYCEEANSPGNAVGAAADISGGGFSTIGAAAMTDARGARGGGGGAGAEGLGVAAARGNVARLAVASATAGASAASAIAGAACSWDARRIAEITAVSRPASGTIRTRTSPLPAA